MNKINETVSILKKYMGYNCACDVANKIDKLYNPNCETETEESWFGYGCVHQICQFEGWYTEDGYEEDKSQPILVFCNHENNPDDSEGNCNDRMCPFENKISIK